MSVATFRFSLAPLLEQRRSNEERARRWVAECAEACARAHRMWEQAVEELGAASREFAVLQSLERKRRTSWQEMQRRRDEREEDDARRY
jgi:flagellar biosynthesis chaperone FliJ